MKKKVIYTLFSTLICACITLNNVSCTDDNTSMEESKGITSFEVEPIVFDGIAEGQEAKIHFIAGAPWTATFTNSNNWLNEPTPSQGKAGEATIRISPCSDNKSSSSRSAELMVLVDGEDMPFMVKITQLSAAESDLEITGDIEDGVMTLEADKTGTKFIGELQITSSSKWNIVTDNTIDWLLFSKDKEPQDGKGTTVKLAVTADYQYFTMSSMEGTFKLQVPGTSPVPIKVKAESHCHVSDVDTHSTEIDERLSYEMTDTMQTGVFQLTFYVNSNIIWELKNLPEWMKLANGTSELTNRNTEGNLQPHLGVGLILKDEYISAEKRTDVIQLTDIRGEVLKTIEVSFDGIKGNFLQHDFAFPSSDPLGGDFSFEAKASYIDANNKNDYWKKMELPFHIKTSVDYSSIENAPYHLIMCNAKNGNILKEEVHWASLRMGDESNHSEANGLFTKEIYLKANDRGDADDQNGLTNPASVREAFIFIVPKGVGFHDLFNPDNATLKEEYAESFSHILQKQDHEITYKLELEGLENGETLYVPAEGGSYTFKVLEVTSEQLTPKLIRLWYNQSNGEWEEKEPTTAQENAVTIGYHRSESTGELETLILNVAPNMVTSTRGFRFNIDVFRGDGYSDANIFTFDIMLKEN